MKFSKRVNNVEPSLARALFNKAKQFSDIIDLTLGDPDFDAPVEIKQAACDAIMQNKTHYSENAGLKDARIAIANHLKEKRSIDADYSSEIIITVGGMEALYLSMFSMIDPGDEVIVLAPYYVNYLQMIRACEGIPVIVDCYSSDYGMRIDFDGIKQKITDKTVAIIVNSPNNPTGAVLPEEDVRAIATLAEEFDLTIISDEVYKALVFDNAEFHSVTEFEAARGRTVLIDSMSKEFCMTGWRCGYAYSTAEMIRNMTKMQENVAACAPLPAQYALIEAYSNADIKTDYLEAFQSRRDYLYNRINKIQGLTCLKPQATFYLFVNIAGANMSSVDFAHALLEQQHVAVVPGEAYGENYKDYVRIAFTKDINQLSIACDKIESFMKSNESR